MPDLHHRRGRPSVGVWSSFTEARRIALVGASERSRFTKNLLATNEAIGFDGEILLVNPRRTTVLGRTAFDGVADIPGEPIDCAIISVPNHVVVESLAEVVSAGIGAVVVHSGGFGELGGVGLDMQRQMAEICHEAGIGLIGPNCIGLVSYPTRVCLSGATVAVTQDSGPIGFVSQSGAIAILAMHSGRDLRFSHVVSTGNEAVITAEDVIGWLIDDPHTEVIGAFVEQIRDPARFLEVASLARAADKPIIMLKSGSSEAGSRAAMSHTGALVGSSEALDAACRRLDVIRVDDFDELFETLLVFSTVPERPSGPRTTIAGISGGQASVLADAAESVGLPLSRPAGEPAIDLLRDNPIDLAAGLGAGQTYADALEAVVDALMTDEEVDQICLVQDLTSGYTEGLLSYVDPFVRAVEGGDRPRLKPLVLVSPTSGLHPAVAMRARAGKLPILVGTRPSLAALRHYGEYWRRTPVPPIQPGPPDTDLERELREVIVTRPSHEVVEILCARYGIRQAPQRIVKSESEALDAVEALGFPVVLKALAPNLFHRTDIGAVRVGLSSVDQVREAYSDISNAVRQRMGPHALDGIAVARHVDGHELYLAIRMDTDFGALLAISLGGVYVELTPEIIEHHIPPATPQEAMELAESLRISPILAGFRGNRTDNLEAFADLVFAMGRMANDCSSLLRVIELNPLIVSDEFGPVAADFKVEVIENGDSGGPAATSS